MDVENRPAGTASGHLVFDPQTAAQAGYALTEKAAREMAAGLVKQADRLAAPTAAKPKAN